MDQRRTALTSMGVDLSPLYGLPGITTLTNKTKKITFRTQALPCRNVRMIDLNQNILWPVDG
jgi:hypothetical protein